MTLVGKELRGALPVACLWWFFWATSLLEHTLSHAPDLVPMERAFEAFREPSMLALCGGLVSLWLANATISAEHASGTVEFLDSLPTTRDRVFGTKLLVGLAILWSGPVLHVAIAYLFHALSRTSVQESAYVAVVVPWLVLASVELTVFFAIALALSFLRRFAWLAAALLVVTYLALRTSVPAVRLLDVTALTEPALMGTSLVPPWRLLAVQVPLALTSILVAWGLFRGLGDRLVRAGERLTEGWLGRTVLALVGLLSIGLWIAVPAIVMATDDDEEEPEKDEHGVVYVGWTRSHATTEHYTVTFPTSLASRAAAVIAAADGIHDRVQHWFESEPIGRIDVDATGAGPAMYAGRAFHETLQMDLASAPSVDDLLATLAHETTHLYIDAVSNRRLNDIFEWTRCLHEGLASYVEYALFRPPADVVKSRKAAALAHAWKRIEFEKFIDDETLSAERDPLLVYTVGEVLMASLVEVHGERAPVRLVSAFGRKDHPQDVSGVDLWRDAFQAAGLDLEAVVNRFVATLDAEKERHAALIASLPRPRGRVVEKTDDEDVAWVGVTPAFDTPLPEGWSTVVRFRRSKDDSMEDFRHAAQDDDTHWVPRTELPGRLAGYQIGLASDDGEIVVWDLWKELSLGR